MRRIGYIVILFVLLVSSCRNEVKLIPEEDLGKIIVESVIAESFLRNTGKLNPYDSLSYYLPILDKYGYTAKDVEYTIERMVQRKSNVFGQLMDKISGDVSKIRDYYEFQSGMGRKWRELVREMAVDTLYFSPESIDVTSYEELKRLDYRVPVNRAGEIIVKYNYKVGQPDSNYVRYMTYNLSDSSTRRRYTSNSYWLNKSEVVMKFEKEIPVMNSYRANVFDMRVMSYNSGNTKMSKKELKGVDFHIDSVTILFRPEFKEAERIYYDRAIRVPILRNLAYMLEDSVTFLNIPYSKMYGQGVQYNRDSVRYDRELENERRKTKKNGK
ncbi:MAG: hypothetical protein RR550_02620 [Rikenellaceae bacterium]